MDGAVMDLASSAWVVTAVLSVWLITTTWAAKFKTKLSTVLSGILLLASVGTWIWYSFYTEQYAFLALILVLASSLVGGYNAGNDS